MKFALALVVALPVAALAQTPQADPQSPAASSPAPLDLQSPSLPDTASPLPLVGLAGLASLAGGLGLRALARRR
jgi:hypothetical protein